MKTWYKAVCDSHLEFADIFVSNPSCTAAYLSDYDRDIQEWLTIHYGCKLRLVHSDEDKDELWDIYQDASKAFVKEHDIRCVVVFQPNRDPTTNESFEVVRALQRFDLLDQSAGMFLVNGRLDDVKSAVCRLFHWKVAPEVKNLDSP